MSEKTDIHLTPPPPSYSTPADLYHDLPSAPQPLSAAQLGDQYRADLYARCAQGIHQPRRRYGVCGIITAAVFFPIGLICLFVDSDRVCERCGVKLDSNSPH